MLLNLTLVMNLMLFHELDKWKNPFITIGADTRDCSAREEWPVLGRSSPPVVKVIPRRVQALWEKELQTKMKQKQKKAAVRSAQK